MITRFEHMSFTVASLDRAVQFWTEGLGFKVASVSERTGDWQARVTGVPGAELKVTHLDETGRGVQSLPKCLSTSGNLLLSPCKNSGGIVVNEVGAGTYADLEDFPLSPGDDPLANLPERLRVAQ